VPAAVSAKTKLSGEERLAKIIGDRVPGEPVSCISQFQTRDLEVIDKTALVYRNGSTLYVNRPRNAESLDDDDVLVTRLHGSQFCSLDIVQTYDRSGHFWNGFVSLGEFVPYRRVAKVAAAD
jgi:predicted membrane channel-forming protein YqfA (hemolysin III family)